MLNRKYMGLATHMGTSSHNYWTAYKANTDEHVKLEWFIGRKCLYGHYSVQNNLFYKYLKIVKWIRLNYLLSSIGIKKDSKIPRWQLIVVEFERNGR